MKSELKIIRQHFIYRRDLIMNPRQLYVFGDNLIRMGMGGQAYEMRGEPNAFGVATKRLPEHGYPECYFWDDKQEDWDAVTADLDALERKLSEKIGNDVLHCFPEESEYRWTAVVVPEMGIGTGLANLHENAPKMLDYIKYRLDFLERIC